jgi:hypothetical protein
MSREPGESESAEFLRLQEEAALARRRFHLCEAGTYSSRPVDPVLVMQREREFLLAEYQLRHANPASP